MKIYVKSICYYVTCLNIAFFKPKLVIAPLNLVKPKVIRNIFENKMLNKKVVRSKEPSI